MSESTTFQTNKLPERYGIARSVVYTRLEALRIKPDRLGNKSYINTDHLALMDDLNAHLKAGGKTEEFVQQCLESGRIAQATAIVAHQSHECDTLPPSQPTAKKTAIDLEVSRHESVENLQARKGERTQLADIQEVNERAQRRAFSKAVAEETLTLIYEATEEFIPELKEQLEQHREKCRQAKAKRTAAHDVNDFLAKSIKLGMS